MASPTVVLITGISRGLGHELAAAYLLRPNHTVIGSVRDAVKAGDLKQLPTAEDSRLILVTIENTSTTDANKAAEEIEAAGIDHIDIVIANAAISHAPAPLDTIDTETMVDAFRINTISAVLLFQAIHKLLANASAPKWISVSSRRGSISQPAGFYWIIAPYGMSKAALHWFTTAINTAIESLTAFVVHPGSMHTDMGVEAARLEGRDRPPVDPRDSAARIIRVIDGATKEEIGGKLVDVTTGEVYPW
ncbi:NAD(P)-binding protein [Nemania sp. FL0916]|nr:NAD(P)-binding protein [Nemania sp. FL0916]